MNDETVQEIASKAKYTLFTNIAFAQLLDIPAIRLDIHALLIEEGSFGFLGPSYQIRGFGPDAAWPVFTFWLKDGPVVYSIADAQDNSKVFLSSSGKTQPIFGGSILTVEDGPRLFLQSDDPENPLDIFESVGDIEKVWNELEDRALKYMHTPYVPHSFYRPKSMPWPKV